MASRILTKSPGEGETHGHDTPTLVVADRWGKTKSVIPTRASDDGVDSSKFNLPSMDSVVKAFAIGGSVIYAALFLAYRTYYSALHVNPEELGINNLYVLGQIGWAHIVCGFPRSNPSINVEHSSSIP